MKILITSDWHLGVRGNSDTYHNIFINWRDNFLIPQIKENNINELCICADIYNDRNEINQKTDNLGIDSFEKILSECEELKIKLILGNHDIFYKSTLEINSLKKFKRLPRTEVIDTIQLRMVGEREIIYCPWLIQKKELEDFVKKFGKADVLFAHLDINGFQMSKGIEEKKGWPQSFFNDNFTKVFSGHFHIRDTKGNISYIGNPFSMDWGDFGNSKGIYILDTVDLKTTFIENKISPRYIKIYLSQLKNKTTDLNSIGGNFIQLILDCDFTDKVLEKLVEIINSKNPLSFKIDGNKEVNLSIDEIQESVSNPLEYLIQYIKELELPNDIDRDRLLVEVDQIYKECIV